MSVIMEPITMEIVMEEGTLVHDGGGGGSGTYAELPDKPSINGTVLEDNYDEIDPTVSDTLKEIQSINNDNLEIVENVLGVKVSDSVSSSDLRPISSQAVSIEIGNIETVLALI